MAASTATMSVAQRAEQLADELRRRAGLDRATEVRVYRAPGRVNLIGEHTDYNDGFVMPAAIDRAVWVAATRRPGREVAARSTAFADEARFALDEPGRRATRHWSDYVRGVALTLVAQGQQIGGATLLVDSDVPDGAGLSSSAALECGTGLALLDLAGLTLPPLELARVGQRAEHEYVGTRCGIMDQFACCCGEAGRVLLLDCRSLQHEPLPLPSQVRLVICNTMVKHELASGEYNTRRAQCEAGVRAIARQQQGVRALRDVEPALLEQLAGELEPVVLRRCRHVVSENERVLLARTALLGGDLPALGRLMAASHSSLRDEYEVSCRELDLMVELAAAAPGLRGARMTGGGFGGCTINLVDAQQTAAFAAHVGPAYQRATGREPQILACEAAPGAARVA